jgi:hypothetical protein
MDDFGKDVGRFIVITGEHKICQGIAGHDSLEKNCSAYLFQDLNHTILERLQHFAGLPFVA